MSITAEIRLLVRQRANFRCEYCGVSETDAGSELTIDHFQPQAKGGNDDVNNLLYCCPRCNQYKADYWPLRPDDPNLWNPRHDPIDTHLIELPDGILYPRTSTGAFSMRRLRLNRMPLVAYRMRQRTQEQQQHLLSRYREIVVVLGQLFQQQAELLEEQQYLLEEQQALLQLLLRRRE